MPLLKETIEVALPVEDAFDAVADFANAERWDPGVVRSRLVREGSGTATGVGAEYAVRVSFRGTESDMRYRTTAHERPRKVVLEGRGARVRAVDTIEFEPLAEARTRIIYTADLRLTGPAVLASPLLRSTFDTLGKDALEGMASWFASQAS
jgi:carbon monoxide dehydrogenase subunit G